MVRLMLSHSRPEVVRLSEWLDEQEQALPIPGDVAYAVRLCLEEAVANLINHTPAVGEGPDIVVDLVRRDDGVVAVIEKLKGHPLFSHVTLVRSERSAIAALVTEMLEDPGL